MGVLSGLPGSNDPLISTFAFCKDVVGYDLEGFFVRNADRLREQVVRILDTLLEPS